MYRYVAFLWNPLDSRASLQAESYGRRLEAASPDWHAAFAGRNLRVYAQAPRTADLQEYALPENHGVILGRLFPSALETFTEHWSPLISEQDCSRFLASSGRALTEEYWGAYVAFLHSPTAPHAVALRDPSGKIPCFRLRHADIDVVFSDVNDLAYLALPSFAPNLRYIATFIAKGSLQIRETALDGVTEILAGECLEIRGATTRQRIAWDAVSIALAQEKALGSVSLAAERLRSVTQACIDSWATVYKRILHFLSGGLDSSIVLGCLARSGHADSVLCLNRFLGSAEGDERSYARISARHAGVALVESPLRACDFDYDSSVLRLPRSPSPSFALCDRWRQLDTINAAAKAHAADAVWTGQGGDHLFLKSADISSAADFLIDKGFRPGLIRVIDGQARLSRRPYVQVWRSAFETRRHPRRHAMPTMGPPCFVRHDALPNDVEHYAVHPWTLAAERLPPGRQSQIALAAEVIHRHTPIPGREFAYQHHPLLSQPLLEQCLRTPSYVHLWGGRPRALAREAFRGRVAREILQREDKGDTTSLVVESIRRSAPFLCELLLDGVLVHEHLIESAEIARCLRDGYAIRTGQLPCLAACIAAEIWARSWRFGQPSVEHSLER